MLASPDSQWLVLTASVKILIMLASFLDISGDFALGDRVDEAKEFSKAGGTRAMLFSTPILFVLRTFSKIPNNCHTGGLGISIIVVGLAVTLYGIYKIPISFYRGSSVPFWWFLLLTIVEVVYELNGVPAYLALKICA